jgi:hypothetical protein
MFSISIRAGKIPDPETAKITGKSWTQNSLGGGANRSNHNTLSFSSERSSIGG